MKLTRSKLKQIIKEELSLMGPLEIEENFVKKNDIQLNEETEEDIYLSLQQAYENLQAALDVASRVEPGLALEIGPIAHKLSSLLEEWPEKRRSREDLDEVYSEKQRRWACTNPSALTAAEAKEMCGDIAHSKKNK